MRTYSLWYKEPRAKRILQKEYQCLESDIQHKEPNPFGCLVSNKIVRTCVEIYPPLSEEDKLQRRLTERNGQTGDAH